MQQPTNEEEILALIPERLSASLQSAIAHHEDICEVRLRSGQPVTVITLKKVLFLTGDGKLSESPADTPRLSKEEIKECFLKLCHYSVYSFEEDLTQGFIGTAAGNRVGVAAKAVVKEGKVCSVKEVFSLNFRVSRSFKANARQVLDTIENSPYQTVMIIGAPCSGKTTLLREICRELSSGYRNEYRRCCVIDERGEIASVYNGLAQKDVGVNTDVLSFFPKTVGILNAVRSLSPEYIFVDELGSSAEAERVLEGIGSGVKFFMTMHASNVETALKRPQFQQIMQGAGVDYLVWLENQNGVITLREVKKL